MNSVTKDIYRIEEEIETLDDQIKNHCIAWAQEFPQKEKSEGNQSEILRISTQIDENDEFIDRLRSLLGDQSDVRQKLKDIRHAESEEFKSKADFYRVLGKRSFELYKRGGLNNSRELESLFRPLTEYEDKIRDADNELYKIRSGQEKKNPFLKVGSMIKKGSQSTIKKTAGDALMKQYKKTGESLVTGGYFTEIAENGLNDIYDEFQNTQALSKKREEEHRSLEERSNLLETELEGCSKGIKPQKLLKNLEEEQTNLEEELDIAYFNRGQELFAGDSEAPFKDLISQLTAQREQKVTEKKILLTEIRIAELDETLEKKERDIESQSDKVAKEKLKLSALQKDKKELLSRKTKLTKEREVLSND